MSGLEVVGSIASVAQLAGAIYTISKTLYEVGNALSNAPSDIKDLAGDLERFSEELHLYARLLDKKHYDDQFHRLTAKIIGECATICTKIDRVLRKLRSGKLWARVKWLYKEKEILKLLTRLRDLKFSLLSVLQLMKYLKADHEIDAIGGPNLSLLHRSNEEGLSKETVAQVEATRKKLAGISIVQEHENARPDTNPEILSDEEPPQTSDFEKDLGSQSTETLSSQTLTESSVADSEREITDTDTTSDVTGSFHTASALPRNSLMQNPNASVQSFYSAFSHFEPGGENAHLSTTESSAFGTTGNCIQSQHDDNNHQSIDSENVNLHVGLKADFVTSLMKHCGMRKEDADAWATASVTRISLPLPGAMGLPKSASAKMPKPCPSLLPDKPLLSPPIQHLKDTLPHTTDASMDVPHQPGIPSRASDSNKSRPRSSFHHSSSSSKGKHFHSKSNMPSKQDAKSDWADITDSEARRRAQNRIAQQKFREKAKEAKQRQERDAENRAYAGHSYTTFDTEEGMDEDLSGLPWGSLSLKHVVSKGKTKESSSRRGPSRGERRSPYEWQGPAYEDNHRYYEADATYYNEGDRSRNYFGSDDHSINDLEEPTQLESLQPKKEETLFKKRGPGSDSYQPRPYLRSYDHRSNENSIRNPASSAVTSPKQTPTQSSENPFHPPILPPEHLTDVVSEKNNSPGLASKFETAFTATSDEIFETTPRSSKEIQAMQGRDHHIMESFFSGQPDFLKIPSSDITPGDKSNVPDTPGREWSKPSDWEMTGQLNSLTPVGEAVLRQLMGLGPLDSMDIGWESSAGPSTSMELDHTSSRASTTHSDRGSHGVACGGDEVLVEVESRGDEVSNDTTAAQLPPQSPTRTGNNSPAARPSSANSLRSQWSDRASLPKSSKSSMRSTAERLSSRQVELTKLATEASFTVSEFRESDYDGFDSNKNSVIRPHEYEDAESDRAQSVGPVPTDLGTKVASGFLNLACESEDTDNSYDESLVREMHAMRRRTRRSSAAIQKRSHAQSIGSSTDDEDVQIALISAMKVGSSARRLRRKIGAFDNHPPRVDESEELESAGDAVGFGENDTRGQSLTQNLPYYVQDMCVDSDADEAQVAQSHISIEESLEPAFEKEVHEDNEYPPSWVDGSLHRDFGEIARAVKKGTQNESDGEEYESSFNDEAKDEEEGSEDGIEEAPPPKMAWKLAAGYAAVKDASREKFSRGRSQARSASSRDESSDSYSSYDCSSRGRSKTADPKQRFAGISIAAAGTAGAARAVSHFRNKSRNRSGERSNSRNRTGCEIAQVAGSVQGEALMPKPEPSMVLENNKNNTTADSQRSTEESHLADDPSTLERQHKELWWRAVAESSLRSQESKAPAREESNPLANDKSLQFRINDDRTAKNYSGSSVFNPASAFFGSGLENLKDAWLKACRNHDLIAVVKDGVTAINDADIARRAAASLEKILGNVGDIPSGTPLHRIGEILKVMKSALDFKVGGLIWTCFCQVIIALLEHNQGNEDELQNSTLTNLADLATLIARYNVMENLYHDWPGMTLEKTYEDSLINLCIIVLQYLDKVQEHSLRPWSAGDEENDLTKYAAKIFDADAACRGFTVTIVPDVVQQDRDRGTKRTMEDAEDSDDDSDSTLVEFDGREASDESSLSVKRVKV